MPSKLPFRSVEQIKLLSIPLKIDALDMVSFSLHSGIHNLPTYVRLVERLVILGQLVPYESQHIIGEAIPIVLILCLRSGLAHEGFDDAERSEEAIASPSDTSTLEISAHGTVSSSKTVRHERV